MPEGDGSIEIHSERVIADTSVTLLRASSFEQDQLSCAIDGLHKDGVDDDGGYGCGGWVGDGSVGGVGSAWRR
jgi:hypothetical protein